jgi:hypothetical protein
VLSGSAERIERSVLSRGSDSTPVTQTLVVERRVVDDRPTAVVRVVDSAD